MLPEAIIRDILEYLPLSNQIGIFYDMDNNVKAKANKIITRSVRKWLNDKRAYWKSIRMWTKNRLFLTKRLTSEQCIQRFVSKKFKKKNLNELEKIKLLSQIAHTKHTE